MLKNRAENLCYYGLQGLFWALGCVVYAYPSVFLLSRGFSASLIGILLAWANIVASVLQPVAAAQADRSRRFSLRAFLLFLCGLCVVCFGALALFRDARAVTVAAFFILFVCCSILQPITNALGMYLNQHVRPLSFGLARCVGSGFGAAMPLLLGLLIPLYTEEAVPRAGLLVAGLFFLLSLSFRTVPCGLVSEGCTSPETAEEPGAPSGVRAYIARYPTFCVMLLGITLLFAFNNITNTYLFQIVKNVGGDSSALSVAIAVSSFSEIPVLALYGRLKRRFGVNRLLAVSALFFFIKSVALFAARSVFVICLAEVLQALSYGLYVASSVYYSDSVMRPADKVKGQAMLTASNTAGGVIGALTGGLLLDGPGMGATLLVSVLYAAVGAVVVVYCLQRPEKRP